MRRFGLFLIISVLLMLTACANRPSPSPGTPTQTAFEYLENKGSDTIVNLALAWAERYQALFPQVRISVTGGGSGTGITALVNGTVDIANASREMKESEIEDARANGFDPVEHLIAIDALAVRRGLAVEAGVQISGTAQRP